MIQSKIDIAFAVGEVSVRLQYGFSSVVDRYHWGYSAYKDGLLLTDGFIFNKKEEDEKEVVKIIKEFIKSL